MCRDIESDFYGGPFDGRPAIYCAEHTLPGFVQYIDERGAYVLTEMADGRMRWRYVSPPPPFNDDAYNPPGGLSGGTD